MYPSRRTPSGFTLKLYPVVWSRYGSMYTLTMSELLKRSRRESRAVTLDGSFPRKATPKYIAASSYATLNTFSSVGSAPRSGPQPLNPPPAWETVFKVAYDEAAMYFGVACLE